MFSQLIYVYLTFIFFADHRWHPGGLGWMS